MKTIDVLVDKAKRHRKGGQSQNRFQKLDDEAEHHFLVRLAEHVDKFFGQIPDLESILVGGPTDIKRRFLDQYMSKKYRDKVIFVVDTGNGGEIGLRDLMQKAKEQNVLENSEYVKEEKIIDEFLDHLAKSDGMIEYGRDNVADKIERGMVGRLLLSSSIGGSIIVDLDAKASSLGATVTVVSMETEKGRMFASLGGIGAFLRWKDIDN